MDVRESMGRSSILLEVIRSVPAPARIGAATPRVCKVSSVRHWRPSAWPVKILEIPKTGHAQIRSQSCGAVPLQLARTHLVERLSMMRMLSFSSLATAFASTLAAISPAGWKGRRWETGDGLSALICL